MSGASPATGLLPVFLLPVLLPAPCLLPSALSCSSNTAVPQDVYVCVCVAAHPLLRRIGVGATAVYTPSALWTLTAVWTLTAMRTLAM